MTVDLETQTITAPDGASHHFDIDPFRKQALLSGQDEIALTLTHAPAITAFGKSPPHRIPLALEQGRVPNCLPNRVSWGTVSTRCTPRLSDRKTQRLDAVVAPNA